MNILTSSLGCHRYQETDWEFIRRLAGLAKAAVIPDRTTGQPMFWFGMRKGGEVNDNGQCRIMMADQDQTVLESSKNLIITANGPVKLGAAAIHIMVPQSIAINQNG